MSWAHQFYPDQSRPQKTTIDIDPLQGTNQQKEQFSLLRFSNKSYLYKLS